MNKLRENCQLTDIKRVEGYICRSMYCERCQQFRENKVRENKDQAIIDMHLREMEGREVKGLEKSAPETYLKLKNELEKLQQENERLKTKESELKRKLDLAVEALGFYGDSKQWETIEVIGGVFDCTDGDQIDAFDSDHEFNRQDSGQRAREALEQIREQKSERR